MPQPKTNHSLLTDEDLMHLLVSSGDAGALSALYKRYSPKLLGYFIKIFNGDIPKAQDFLQDVFVRILEKKHLYDTNRKFNTWMFTIASNMCKMSFRDAPTHSLNEIDS